MTRISAHEYQDIKGTAVIIKTVIAITITVFNKL